MERQASEAAAGAVKRAFGHVVPTRVRGPLAAQVCGTPRGSSTLAAPQPRHLLFVVVPEIHTGSADRVDPSALRGRRAATGPGNTRKQRDSTRPSCVGFPFPPMAVISAEPAHQNAPSLMATAPFRRFSAADLWPGSDRSTDVDGTGSFRLRVGK